MGTIKKIVTKIQNTITGLLRAAYRTVDRKPLPSFFTVLGVLLVLIIAGNILRAPAPAPMEKVRKAKEVAVYAIGTAPRIRVQARIEKSGVIKLVAQSGGVVQNIYKKEGDAVGQGTWLFSLSTNYQGGNAPSLTRQIAEKNYNFLKDTYDTQKDIIAKNRESATKLESQAAALRDIGSKSVDETNSLIAVNEDVLGMLDSQIQALEAINVNGSSNSAILQLKQGKAQALAGLNQAKASLRQTEYQTNGDNEPADLARLQRDTTLKQLDIQEKSLDLNRDVALLNLRLAQIQESLMYPASPVAGKVERIYVRAGQNVSSGTLLATITGNSNCATAVVSAPAPVAVRVSNLEASAIQGRDGAVSAYPSYVSTEPTDGTLYSIIFPIPEADASQFGDGQIVAVDMPVGTAGSNAAIPYIPLDAVYQTDSESYIYVVAGNGADAKAGSRKVELGPVTGGYVEVRKGLGRGDQVILDRNVIDGDSIQVSL